MRNVNFNVQCRTVQDSEFQCKAFIVYFLDNKEKQDVVGRIILAECKYRLCDDQDHILDVLIYPYWP